MSPNSPLARWLSFFLDAFFISAAWFICSLPVVTLGASTAALNRMAFHWMKHRSDCDVRHFLMHFRKNLKQGIAVWLILAVPLAVILFNSYTVWISRAELPAALSWLVALSAVLWLAVAVYTFALQAIFENTPWRTVLNGLRIAVATPIRSICLALLFAAAAVMTLLFPYGAFLYTPVCVFLGIRPVWAVFAKIVSMSEDHSENIEIK